MTDMTNDNIERLLALCEAAPTRFLNIEERLIQDAADFYQAAYRLVPALVAHCRSETARADEASGRASEATGIAIRERSRAERAEAKLREAHRGVTEAVAWRVKDFADGWILCHSEAQARRAMKLEDTAVIQPLYLVPDRGPMPEQRVSDEALAMWMPDVPSVVELDQILLDLRDLRAWVKTQDKP